MEEDTQPELNYLPEGSFLGPTGPSVEERLTTLEQRMNFHRHTTADRTQPISKDPITLSIVSTPSLTPDPYEADMYIITALAEAITINNPGGQYLNGKKLVIRIRDNGTSRAISFGSAYRATTVSLPTATTAGKAMYMGFMFNDDEKKWDILANITTV
jgi:hypothetical protein